MDRLKITCCLILITLLTHNACADDLYPAAPDLKSTRTEKVTYLGVTAKAVDDTLRAQLDLPDGIGLTVTTVDRNGPAASDIKPNDVLQKLDDQLLIDSHQLVTLIRLHKAGDSVTLTIIRASKPIQVKVTLGEAMRPVTQGNDHNLPGDNTPDDLNAHVPFIPPASMGVGNQVMFTFKDDVYNAQVTTDPQGHKDLTVKDTAGKVVAEGLIDTTEQWQKFSPDVRQHLQVLHEMMVGPTR